MIRKLYTDKSLSKPLKYTKSASISREQQYSVNVKAVLKFRDAFIKKTSPFFYGAIFYIVVGGDNSATVIILFDG